MTGPEHYKAAEQILSGEDRRGTIGMAQVHALLALAAATAINLSLSDYQAWTNLAARIDRGDTQPYSPSREGGS